MHTRDRRRGQARCSSTDLRIALPERDAAWQAPTAPNRSRSTMPSPERGLLARLDALVAFVADRHGLALLPDGRLAAAEARVAARATGLVARPRPARPRPARRQPPQPNAPAPTPAAGSVAGDPAAGRRPGGRGLALVERDAVELLRAVAEGGSGCCRCAATGWRPRRCATPGARSTRASAPGLPSLPGASK